MRILVVDDEPAVREALDRALRLQGYDVALCQDGADALVRLRAQLELSRGLHGLSAAKDGGLRGESSAPHGPRRWLRPARGMSFRQRLIVVAAIAVAVAVVLASLVIFFVVRAQLRTQVDDSLEKKAAEVVEQHHEQVIVTPDGRRLR